MAVANEAGPTGFGLCWALRTAGIRREVAAPSRLHRPPADRVKTDAKDALLLARLRALHPSVTRGNPAWCASRLFGAGNLMGVDVMRRQKGWTGQ